MAWACRGSRSAERHRLGRGRAAGLEASWLADPLEWSALQAHSLPHGRGDRLTYLQEACPRVGGKVFQSLWEVADVEGVGPYVRFQLLPEERSRDWRAGPGARGIGGDGSGAAAVAQVVDVDLAFAAGLGHVGGVARGLLRRDAVDDRLGEGLDLIPLAAAHDRDADMEPLAAGRLEEGLK